MKRELYQIIFLLFPLLIFSEFTLSQQRELRVDYYTVDQGLSQNQVVFVYGDSQGLLWIGTQDGLNLYDGYKFRVFRHEPGNENSLLDYAVNTICETDTGIFWIGTREGMSKFNLRTGKYTHFTHNPDSSNTLVDNNVWLIIEDKESNLWIGTKEGLSKFNPAENEFTNYKFNPEGPNTISNNFIFAAIEEKDNIWFGGRGGIDRYNLNDGKFYNYKLNPENPNSVSLNGVLDFVIVDHVLWIAAYSGFYSLKLGDVQGDQVIISKHSLDSNPNLSTKRLCKGYDGSIWIGTFGAGLFHFYPNLGKVFKYNKSNKPGSISDDYINALYEDENKVLWIGTATAGLNKFNRSSEIFKTLTIPQKNNEGNYSISALLEDKSGNLWVGTETGDIIKVTNQFSDNPKFHFFETEKYLKTYFRPIEVRSISTDSNGKIWAATFGNGIYLIDPASNELKRIRQGNDGKSLANDFVHEVYESSDGKIWIGTGAGGLNLYDPIDKTFTHYLHNPNDSKTVSSDEVTSVREDADGIIWAGTSIGGLNRLDTNTGEFERFIHDVKDVNSISSNRIICLYVDKNSNLWIGTFGGGLNKWIPETRYFQHYTTDDGLPSNIINWIIEDAFGNLWINTDKGISEFNIEQNVFQNYDVNDGLQGNEFLHGAGYLSKSSGNIYVGGVNGINIFNPADLKTQSKKADIVFTDFRIFNKSVNYGEDSPLSTNIIYADEVLLSYDQNFITFEFASLDFNNPDKNQYAYKMEGFNKEWINAGNQRTATFTNLDPGEYTFRVKATNSNGVWNDEGISMKVFLKPPWWQTWWAYLIYAAAIGAILFFVRQFEIKRVKLRNELELREVEAKKLQEVDKLKSRFFANISHEFRTPLTLVLGLTDKLLKKSSDQMDKKDFGVIRKNAHRLLQLINQLLELSKLEAGNVNLKVSKYDINKFLRRILASFTSLAEQKNITFTFNERPVTDSIDSKEVFLYIDREKFETIVYNLISNAFKFSPNGERIEVEVTPHLHHVDIRFTNTGVSIPEDKIPFIFDRFYQVDETTSRDYEGTGIGLALVKELVELHNGEIKVNSIDDKETTFEIRIPVGRAHYSPEQVFDDETGKEKIPEGVELLNYDLSGLNISSDEIDTQLYGTSEKTLASADAKIILVVEDNFDLRNYISEQLEEGYTIYEAEDGEQGLEMASEILPDLIISDIMMPKMDGYEMSRKLKKDFKTSHIPIIMLTAKAAKDDKLEGLEIGADDYLVKPFDPEELLIRVRNLIKLRAQMREKFRSEMILKPREVIVPSTEKIFLDRVSEIIETRIGNEKFGVDELSKEIGLSRSQLHRKLKAVSDQTTTEFIRNFRLQRAADLIKQNAGNMAEIAYQVGFSSQAYFTKSFTELFGISPGEYKKRNS